MAPFDLHGMCIIVFVWGHSEIQFKLYQCTWTFFGAQPLQNKMYVKRPTESQTTTDEAPTCFVLFLKTFSTYNTDNIVNHH